MATIKTYSIQDQGGREYQEDRFLNLSNNKYSIISIFDGHGGDAVSEMCVNTLHLLFEQALSDNDYLVDKSVFSKCFQAMDNIVEKMNVIHVGSTCVFVVVLKDRIWVANVGDSECYVRTFTNVVNMTKEHKVENEIQRLIDLDALITYTSGFRIQGVLNLSRSFGDFVFKTWVISEPFVKCIARKNVKHIVLASDGIWDVMSHIEVDDYLHTLPGTIQEKLQKIVDIAKFRGSTDNITITFVEIP
jgi:serine/threonine protein phosphatase PrpC